MALLSMILNKVHYSMKTTVNSSAMILWRTEILTCRRLLITRHMNSMLYKLLDTLILAGRNRNDRKSQGLLHLIDQYRSTVFLHLIHEVERKNHRDIQFHELHGEIKVTLDIRCIDNIYDARNRRMNFRHILA